MFHAHTHACNLLTIFVQKNYVTIYKHGYLKFKKILFTHTHTHTHTQFYLQLIFHTHTHAICLQFLYKKGYN
jgi:hypothetical protein